MPQTKPSILHSKWVTVIGCVAAVAAYVFFWHLPQRKAMALTRRTIADQQQYLEKSTHVRGELDRLTEELHVTQRFCQSWADKAPRESELTVLFGRIHHALNQAGAGVTRLEPLAPVDRKTLRQIPLRVVTTGNFLEVAGALVKLEELPGTIWIEDLSLKPVKEHSETLQCEAKLVVFAVSGDFSKELDRSDNR